MNTTYKFSLTCRQRPRQEFHNAWRKMAFESFGKFTRGALKITRDSADMSAKHAPFLGIKIEMHPREMQRLLFFGWNLYL